METLNADCILEILKYLDLRDQISMVQVNTFIQQVVHILWAPQYKHIPMSFDQQKLTDNECRVFFREIQDIAEVLELRFMDHLKFEILKRYKYPNVHTLRLILLNVYLKDSDVRDLHPVFPNLIIFSPDGNLTGKYLNLLPRLKELNLSQCYKLDLEQFYNIMKVLRLDRLELNVFHTSGRYSQLDWRQAHVEQLKYLRLNTYELFYLFGKPMPSLKELKISDQYNFRKVFDFIFATWPTKDIQSVESTNVKNVLSICIAMKMNVPELIICNDTKALTARVIYSLYLLENLRKLRFHNCKLYKVDFTQLLKSVPQCDEVSLENCCVDEQKVELDVPTIAKQRTKPLTLNFYRNLHSMLEKPNNYAAFDPFASVSLNADHEFFEVTNERKGLDLCFEPLYIKFR